MTVRPSPSQRRLAVAVLVALASVAVADPASGPTAALPSTRPQLRAAPRPSSQAQARPDPLLAAGMDQVMALSPPDSCLTVAIDGAVRYRYNRDRPLVPASTEKLITASVALDQLGREHRFRTTVVAARPPRNATVTGDLTLVGGGDPQLTSSIYRGARPLDPSRPSTSLDDLAAKVAASGVRHVTGRVVGDERRYDQARVVPSWPPNYAAEQQAGPLSALDVDDGYTLRPVAGGFARDRSPDPAAAAAATFTALLRVRGVRVDGAPGSGRAPGGSSPVASIESAPLGQLVTDMLSHSDNQTAELLAKELGRRVGHGTTAAGATVISRWRATHGLAPAGATTVDGSGLDRGNRVTCDELTTVLGLGGGRAGVIAGGLPVAATSGTLIARFRGSPAAGRLRAKTGSLNGVTALVGFVDLPDGAIATFAYLANGAPITASVLAAQDYLGTLLAGYRPPCPKATAHRIVAPISPSAVAVALLLAGPGAFGALPATVASVDAIQRLGPTLADRCTAADDAVTFALDP
ncbi:MAG: D-alanyl-D-alanine carboxypeptidase/D-alanyl-D-alanine-endopeptidase [Acidimicrobiales bacterium]